MNNDMYYNKYQKYKNKYVNAKIQTGGGNYPEVAIEGSGYGWYPKTDILTSKMGTETYEKRKNKKFTVEVMNGDKIDETIKNLNISRVQDYIKEDGYNKYQVVEQK